MQQPPGSESRGPPRTLKGSCHRLRPNTDQQLADSHDAAGLGRSASPGAGRICECEHCSLTSATWNPRRSGQRVLAGHSGRRRTGHEPPHHLHVLLRHRLRSISRGAGRSENQRRGCKPCHSRISLCARSRSAAFTRKQKYRAMPVQRRPFVRPLAPGREKLYPALTGGQGWRPTICW